MSESFVTLDDSRHVLTEINPDDLVSHAGSRGAAIMSRSSRRACQHAAAAAARRRKNFQPRQAPVAGFLHAFHAAVML
jgi:hypothetical protein